jgi:hypothetical protein
LPANERGCRIYKGGKYKEGYGRFCHEGKVILAHRYVAHLYFDIPLDSPLHVLHKCDNPPCIEPEHLRPGNQFLNTLDAMIKNRFEKPFCKRGHPMLGENIGRSKGQRYCRACNKLKGLIYYRYNKKLREQKCVGSKEAGS